MTVEFKDGKQVTISNENGSITLPRVEAAAGVKYELEGVIFWSRGIDAAYTAPGMASTMCRR
jgi:membrane-bound inhibitor of C-type lysozyme